MDVSRSILADYGYPGVLLRRYTIFEAASLILNEWENWGIYVCTLAS